jgi:hypothetical protein
MARVSTTAGASTLIMSRNWLRSNTETSFVIRAIAGAATRFSAVTIAIPGSGGTPLADGVFDLHQTGGDQDLWPSLDHFSLPGRLADYTHVIADDDDETLSALLAQSGREIPIHVLASIDQETRQNGMMPLELVPMPDSAPVATGLFVPINPLAATHRHNGLGFTDYLLVLTDRQEADSPAPPSEAVAWLTAAFHGADVVVIEGGSAAVWKGRVLRGVVAVETRTDLWRLIAHAKVTIDLRPGPIVARECIESLRFGTPIIVPARSRAMSHAEFGTGATFGSIADLVDAIDQLDDANVHASMRQEARNYANTWYGNPNRFVSSLADSLRKREAL